MKARGRHRREDAIREHSERNQPAAVPLTFSPHDYDPLLEWIGDRGLGLIGQFDAVIHIDRTMALIPFERRSVWEKGEVPETYPFAV